MPDLATVTDLEARLGRDLTPAEAGRAGALLADVSASIRAFTGQDFSRDTTTDYLPVRRGRVRLPQRPVVDVVTVEDLDGSPVAWQWLRGDLVEVVDLPLDTFEWVPYRGAGRTVQIEYVHGYEPLPPDVVGVVSSVTLRALGQSPTMAGVTSESIQGYSYSIGATGAAGAFGLLEPERAILQRYMRRVSFIDTGPLR